MKKAELVKQMAMQAGVTQPQAARALQSMLDIIKAELKAGNRISLASLGTFYVRHQEARTVRNPQTGANIQVGASNLAKFKPSAALKATLR